MGDNTKKGMSQGIRFEKKMGNPNIKTQTCNTTVSKQPSKRAKNSLISKSVSLSLAPKKSPKSPQNQKRVTAQIQTEA